MFLLLPMPSEPTHYRLPHEQVSKQSKASINRSFIEVSIHNLSFMATKVIIMLLMCTI